MLRRRALAAAVVALTLTAGCTSLEGVAGEPGPSVPPTPTTRLDSEPTNDPSATPVQDDLTKTPLRRIYQSDGFTVAVDYQPGTPVDSWTAAGTKTLRVRVSVKNNRNPRQKVYLTRATMRFTVSDGDSDVQPPDPLTDSANIAPGYLVRSPYGYVQSFSLPPLDPSARALQLDLKFELVSLVDAKAKDYTKQTVTDTVRTRLSF